MRNHSLLAYIAHRSVARLFAIPSCRQGIVFVIVLLLTGGPHRAMGQLKDIRLGHDKVFNN